MSAEHQRAEAIPRAEVIPLRPDEVHNAEVVVEQPRPTFNTRRISVPQVPEVVRHRFAEAAVVTTRVSVPVVKGAGQAAIRHAGYVAMGAAEAWRSRPERSTQRDLTEAIRAARMEGNLQAVRELEETRRASKTSRWERVKLQAEAAWKLAKAGLITTAAAGSVWTAITLGHVGYGLYEELGGDEGTGFADVWTPWWDWNASVAAGVGTVVDLVLSALPYGAGAVGLAILANLHKRGRSRADLPKWLCAPEQRDESASTVVDESVVMTALRQLGHTKLDKKFKEGWGSSVQPTWVQPPMPVGSHGWECALRLPGGVPVAEIAHRKTTLAHNLGRRPEEVWVEVDNNDPMAMRLFVLNPGALREPPPPYPLVEEGTTNFWTGVPIGVDARRNPVVTSVFERNFVIAGIMGSGKSSQIQTLLAGLALDPLVDIDVFCFADNNDYEFLRPVANVYMGAGEMAVQRCLTAIEYRYENLATKGQLLKKHNIPSVTREAAKKDPRLRPRVIVIDECQALFRKDDPGERRSVVNMLVNFMTTARKYAEVLIFATPTPSHDSLPRDLVSVATNRACFAIGDKTRNNVVLGDKAHENGLSALGLKPAKKKDGKMELNDVGTSITIGYMDEPGLLRSYNLSDEEKQQVIERAVKLRGGVVDQPEGEYNLNKPQLRDLLTDTAAVLADHTEPVPAADVIGMLRGEFQHHRPYRELTKATLAEQLGRRGVRVPSTGNRYPVDPHAVRTALAAEQASDGTDGTEE